MNLQTSAYNDAHFRLFTVLWSLAHLVHIFQDLREVYSTDALLIIASVWALWDRRRALPLLVMATLQIANVIQHLPMVSNHWVLAAAVNASLLVSFALHSKEHPRTLLQGAAPAIRWIIGLLYFFAVLHKLNWDFFATETSCASEFYRQQASTIPILPDSRWMERLTIAFTLAVETAIPLLILWPRTRVFGAAVGAVFHYLVAANPNSHYYNFSAVLFALFFLCVAADFEETWRRKFRGIVSLFDASTVQGTFRRIAAIVGFGGLTVAGALYSNPPLFDVPVFDLPAIIEIGTYLCYTAILWVWIVYGSVCLAVFVLALGAPSSAPAPRLDVARPAFWPIVLVFFVNGMSPYLGIKSETSFAMYSNLRTAGNLNNHLFMPTSIRVFPFLDDIVRIESSEHPILKTYVGTEFRLVYPMFVDIVQTPIAPTTYEVGGETHTIESENDIPVSQPAIFSKLFGYRPVDSGPVHCTH